MPRKSRLNVSDSVYHVMARCPDHVRKKGQCRFVYPIHSMPRKPRIDHFCPSHHMLAWTFKDMFLFRRIRVGKAFAYVAAKEYRAPSGIRAGFLGAALLRYPRCADSKGKMFWKNMIVLFDFLATVPELTRATVQQSFEEARVMIRLFTLSGRLLRVIENAKRGEVFDGRDTFGNLLSPGVYLYQISAADRDRLVKSKIEKLAINPPR
jgi:hypothetical protein